MNRGGKSKSRRFGAPRCRDRGSSPDQPAQFFHDRATHFLLTRDDERITVTSRESLFRIVRGNLSVSNLAGRTPCLPVSDCPCPVNAMGPRWWQSWKCFWKGEPRVRCSVTFQFWWSAVGDYYFYCTRLTGLFVTFRLSIIESEVRSLVVIEIVTGAFWSFCSPVLRWIWVGNEIYLITYVTRIAH